MVCWPYFYKKFCVMIRHWLNSPFFHRLLLSYLVPRIKEGEAIHWKQNAWIVPWDSVNRSNWVCSGRETRKRDFQHSPIVCSLDDLKEKLGKRGYHLKQTTQYYRYQNTEIILCIPISFIQIWYVTQINVMTSGQASFHGGGMESCEQILKKHGTFHILFRFFY